LLGYLTSVVLFSGDLIPLPRKTDLIIEVLGRLAGHKVEAETVVYVLENYFVGRYIFDAADTAVQRKTKVNGLVRSHCNTHAAQGDAKIGKETVGRGQSTRAFMWYIRTARSQPPQAIANSDTCRALWAAD
jgi:hypothetical protein